MDEKIGYYPEDIIGPERLPTASENLQAMFSVVERLIRNEGDCVGLRGRRSAMTEARSLAHKILAAPVYERDEAAEILCSCLESEERRGVALATYCVLREERDREIVTIVVLRRMLHLQEKGRIRRAPRNTPSLPHDGEGI